jgi:hypothetical protein
MLVRDAPVGIDLAQAMPIAPPTTQRSRRSTVSRGLSVICD